MAYKSLQTVLDGFSVSINPFMDMPKRNRKTQDSRNLQESASDDNQEKIEYEWVVEKKSENEMAVSINFKNPYDISASGTTHVLTLVS